jgi:hypothetical protein
MPDHQKTLKNQILIFGSCLHSKQNSRNHVKKETSQSQNIMLYTYKIVKSNLWQVWGQIGRVVLDEPTRRQLRRPQECYEMPSEIHFRMQVDFGGIPIF